MSNCCADNTEKQAKVPCPGCSQSGHQVSLQTLLLNVSFPENKVGQEETYYYCAERECDVAYFSKAGSTIPKHKLSTDKDLLCYCFSISIPRYKAALQSKTAEPIKAFVVQMTKTGVCACELKNPSGQCCLKQFKRLEKQYEETL